VSETQDKEIFLSEGTDDEVNRKVVEGGFFHADRLLSMAPGQMTCHY
jgi:hypothetical protein